MGSARWAIAGAVLGATCPAMGQVDLSFGDVAVKTLRDNNILHGPISNPFQPISGKPLDPKDQVLPGDLGESTDFKLLHGDVTMHGSEISIQHDCIFLVRGYRVSCDHAFGNLKSRIFTLQGNVHVDSDSFSLRRAGTVSIDFIHEDYVAFDGEAQLSPAITQGSLKDKLYVQGQESFGSPDQTTTLNGSATTCNLPDPHYEIDAKSTVVKPGKKIIFRKAKLKILGYTVLRIPYLELPLDDRTYRNTPYAGYSPDEGYFVKMRYGIPLKNPNYGIDTREEIMTKLGLGLGIGYYYAGKDSAGTASIYHIFGSSDELDITESHRQAFKWGTLSIDNDYEKDNHLTNPDGTTFNTKIAFVIPQGSTATDKLTLTRAASDSFGYSTDTDGISFEDQRSWGPKTQTTLDLNYFGSSSSFQSSGLPGTGSPSEDTQQLQGSHLQAQQDLTQAVGSIQYQRSIPIGTTPTSISGSDETPVIALDSDGKRLFGSKFGSEFPFKAELSWGDFQNPETNSPISRGYFDVNFNKIDTSKGPFKIDYNGDFKQGIYSDDTAEYVLTFGTNMRYALGPDTGLNLRYNYLRPYGYSPLAIDETGQTNFVSGDLNYRPIKSFLVGAQTGYDLVRLQQHLDAWQELSLRTEYQPSKWFMLRGLYTYDTINCVWEDVRFDLTYVPGATKLSIGSDFDGPSHTWSAVNVYLTGFKWGKMTFSTALAYNGYLKQFDTQQYNIIYDLHCVDAVFDLQENDSGFQAGRTVQFYIRIKALNYDNPFGIGPRGTAVGMNSGPTF